MYLKRLEILGFKSFAHKTTIDFSKGITAIVGPNGCGKTNILDALRWVLGEQKVTLLRGSKMEEVIFNGTRDMKPLGMSEVTLTLVNNRGILPTEYSEVQITRRLFRSGESEYLLNKVPCRLKDISELFYDTGVGAHSYSVIQQDMIEAVISDKAEERRFLFEEAAGITKYKQRKKAALRKLEATENDFLRLNDIYAEVQTQARSLKRQQHKAERYQLLANEIKAWDLYLNAQRIKAVEREKRDLRASLDSLNDQQVQKETAINTLASHLETDRNEQLSFERQLNQVGAEIYDISEKAHSCERETSVLREKRSNAQLVIERNSREIEALQQRAIALSSQINEEQSTLVTRQHSLAALQTEIGEAENRQSEADAKLLDARRQREHKNQKMIELEGRLSSGRTEEDNLRQQESEFDEQIKSLGSEIDTARSKRGSLIEQNDIKKEQQRLLTEQKLTIETEVSERKLRLEQLIIENEDLSQEIADFNVSLEAAQARKNLLEDMIIHYEGYESGVKTAMESRELWPGILGTVAEKFVPVEGMEAGVEAALGEMARFLICDSRKTAEAIIRYLKQEQKGRIGILVPQTGTINPAVKRPEIDDAAFLGWLDSFVTTKDSLRPLMQAVLARTAVFKEGSNPDGILAALPYGFMAVSTSGELFSKNIMAGGSDDKLPLFRRGERVQEQMALIEEYGQKLAALRDRKNQTTAGIGSTRAELSRLDSQLESATEELGRAAAALSESDYQLKSLETELTRLEKEKKQHSDKLESIRSRQYTLNLDSTQLAAQKNSLVSALEKSSETLGDLEISAAQSLEKLSQLQVKLVENRSAIEQTESKMKHLRELEFELSRTAELKKQEIDQAQAERLSAGERITLLEDELKKLFETRKELTDRQNNLRTNQAEIMEQAGTKERSLKELRQGKEAVTREAHLLEIKLNSLESESRTVCEKMREEHDVDISTIEAACPNAEISDEEALRHLHDLKEQLKKFGAVNLLALEEYRTASEREVFLKTQLDDLTTAKNDLQTTITRINQTARQLFVETFDKVRLNFQNLFVELFTGGEADILLRDPNDPLESDIEIIARPRGKKLLSITMMSGGERALTAISLLFSLYLVKPSPFCILDEIDAPLDDANCRRFLKIIDTFSDQTQFIIITHNKITMEASHNLYGVTMEQLGISKLVAVKFNEEESSEASPERLVIVHNEEPFEETTIEDVKQAVQLIKTPGNGHSREETEDDLPEEIRRRMGAPVSSTETEESSQE